MPLYSGPDLLNEPTPDISAPNGANPSPYPHYLRQDVEAYAEIREQLLEQDITQGLPPGTTEWGTLLRNPFAGMYMQHRALQDMGYGIHFVEKAIEEKAPGSRPLSIHVHNADLSSVSTVMTRSVNGIHLPYNALFYGGVASRLDASAVHFEGTKYYTATNELAVAHAYDDIDQLLVRGFLTRQIVTRLWNRTSVASPTLRQLYTNIFLNLKDNQSLQDVELYEDLRQKGETPFTVKELYAMAAKLTSLVVASPDIAPLYSY